MSSREKTPECPLCGKTARYAFESTVWQIHNASRVFKYGECENCEALFCIPIPTQSEIDYIYRYYYNFDWFIKHRLLKKMQAWHRYRNLKRLFLAKKYPWNAGRLLDIGCGHGWFLEEALKEGWETFGIDHLEDEVLKEILAKGIRFEKGTLEDSRFPKNHFDLITLWHTLEHSKDPKRWLNIVSGLLRTNGYCIIAVPNRDSKALARARITWEWLQEPFVHTFCFSKTSLERIIPKTLLVVGTISQDTLDQQYVRYTALMRIYRVLIGYGFGILGKAFRKIGLSKMAKYCDHTYFLFSQIGFVLGYFLYLLLRIFGSGRDGALKDSELLVITKKSAEQ